MKRRKNIRQAPTYHSRLFNTEEDAQKFIDRMKLKMGPDFTYEVKWNDTYELYHGRFWDTRDGEGYIIK